MALVLERSCHVADDAVGTVGFEFQRQFHEKAKLPVGKTLVDEPEEIVFRQIDQDLP